MKTTKRNAPWVAEGRSFGGKTWTVGRASVFMGDERMSATLRLTSARYVSHRADAAWLFRAAALASEASEGEAWVIHCADGGVTIETAGRDSGEVDRAAELLVRVMVEALS